MDFVAAIFEESLEPELKEERFGVEMHGDVIYQTMKFEWVAPPATRDSYGEPGQMSYSDDYFYLCVAPNLWARTILAKGW